MFITANTQHNRLREEKLDVCATGEGFFPFIYIYPCITIIIVCAHSLRSFSVDALYFCGAAATATAGLIYITTYSANANGRTIKRVDNINQIGKKIVTIV